MKSSIIKHKHRIFKFLGLPNLIDASRGLDLENDPYQMALAELKRDLETEKRSGKELDRKIMAARYRLKKIDQIYQKVNKGEPLNDLESILVDMVRI